MRDDQAVAGEAGGGTAARSGGPVAIRRTDKAHARGRVGPHVRPEGRESVGPKGRPTERVRRQVLLDAETACRFDVHCRAQMPQLDPVKELNRILLSYLRQHGRKKEALDPDFPRPESRVASDIGEDRQAGTSA